MNNNNEIVESHPGISSIALMESVRAAKIGSFLPDHERDALYETVFLPVVDAFAPLEAVATAPAGYAHVRGGMIGTLLEDLASGLDSASLGVSAEFVRAVAPAGPNLLVVRTAIGAAQRVALTLDRLNWPEIVGTLSGDDTIFIATTTLANQRRVQRRLQDNLRAL